MKPSSFFILIISLSCLNLKAQTVSEVVEFANQQFEEENYAIAAKEYNRAFFFGYHPKDVLSLQIAHCYAQLTNYDLAATFYDKAYLFSNFDSIKDEAILGKSFCLLIQQKYVLALSELLNFSNNTSLVQKEQYHFQKAIAHYGINQDSSALYEFNEVIIVASKNDSISKALRSEFDKIFRYNKRFNPQRAYIMSALLPGSGQFSVGAFKEGLNSIVLITGLYLIAAQLTGLYSFWDAAIAIFPWIQRYYTGGMDKSKALAFSKIEAKRYESYLKIIELTAPTNY